MIWGAILTPGEPYTELVAEEVRLSMASLEYRSSKTAVPSPTSHVVISTEKGEYLLCSLEKGSTPQQSLDLVLKPKEEVTFIIEGTGVVHLTGYTQESPQQFVRCSPEEEEMIFVDEQGSDEPDVGLSSQAHSNVDLGGDAVTNQSISEDSSQSLNSSKPPDNSCQGAIVKLENLSDSPGEELGYEGWIAEENQLMMPKSPDRFENEGVIVNNLLQSVLWDDAVTHDVDDDRGGNDREDDCDDGDDDVSSLGWEDNSDDGDWNPQMADSPVFGVDRRTEKTQDHVDEDNFNQPPKTQMLPSSKTIVKLAVDFDKEDAGDGDDDDDDEVVDEEEEGFDEVNQSTAHKTQQTFNREQHALRRVEANNGRCNDENRPRFNPSIHHSHGNRWKSSTCPQTVSKPFVEPSKSSATWGRVWDKYSYCLYCSKRQCKLVRHLKSAHREEVLVTKGVALQREGKKLESKKVWSKIRNHGNFEHNKKVHLGEADDLIVVKRPEYWQSCSVSSYTPCSDCLGYFLSKSLWKHKTVCSERKKKAKEGKRHLREGRSLIPLKHAVSEQLRMVVSGLIEDKISAIVRNDKDILDVGERDIEVIRCTKKEQTIRGKMRLLANAVDIGRSLSDNRISCGEDLVKTAAFETVGKVAKIISGYNEKTKEYEYFSNVRKLGFALRDLALVVRGRFIRNGEKEQAREVDEFMKLRENQWTRVTGCHQEIKDSCHHPEIQTVTEYYFKLCDYLSKEESSIKAGFTKGGELPSPGDLTRLKEVTFAQVWLFNCHRSGEVESLEVSKYLQQMEEMKPIEEEMKRFLTIPEVVALDRLKPVSILVKEGKNSLILLTESMKKSLDIIIKSSQESANGQIYLFSEDASTPLAGSSIIPKLAEKAGLQHPNHVYCANFHRQIATVVQLQELKERELEQLATLMGHNIVVHCEYYRMPRDSILMAKLMKLLTLMEKEKSKQIPGKVPGGGRADL